MIIRMRTISLLQTLIDYANTGKINIKHGSIVTPDEKPLAQLPFTGQSTEPGLRAFDDIIYCLDMLQEHGDDAIPYLAKMVNSADLKLAIVSTMDSCYAMPIPNKIEDVPISILAALMVEDQQGALMRIGHCEKCNKYFVRKTQKKSQFCSKKCRWDYGNLKKKGDTTVRLSEWKKNSLRAAVSGADRHVGGAVVGKGGKPATAN